MRNGFIDTSDIRYVPTDVAPSIARYRIAAGDLFISVAGTLGLVGKVPPELHMANLTENADMLTNIKCDRDYLLSVLLSDWVQNAIEQVKTTSAQPKLALERIRDFTIPLPPLPEQQKIAEILSTWDKAIQTTEALLANARIQKRALMQSLLTGTRRFPGFEDHPWREVRIGTVASEVSVRNADGGKLPVISCTKATGFVNSLDFFKKQVFSDDLSGYKVVTRGQIAYPSNHVEEGSIGLQNLYDRAIVSPIYTVFQPGPKIDPKFMFRVLKSNRHRQLFASATSASVDRRGSLRWKAFSLLPVPLPTLDEQRAINEALDVADNLVTSHEKDLDRLRSEKKSLMQQLLTGKRRVAV